MMPTWVPWRPNDLPVSPKLWRKVNDHFRNDGSFYVEAPRPWAYRRKQRSMYREYPTSADAATQAAYLAKNLVNLQRYPDANKRTASVLLEVFLRTQSLELVCSDEAYAEFLLSVQRTVPREAWDGRTFTLRPEYIPWREDDYHHRLRDWFLANAIRKT